MVPVSKFIRINNSLLVYGQSQSMPPHIYTTAGEEDVASGFLDVFTSSLFTAVEKRTNQTIPLNDRCYVEFSNKGILMEASHKAS